MKLRYGSSSDMTYTAIQTKIYFLFRKEREAKKHVKIQETFGASGGLDFAI